MTQPAAERPDLEVLREVAQRVLWLSAAIVDAANRGRPNDTGVKVGGHQASSASMVEMMVALWFHELTPLDRVSVKPHASPVLHAVNHLLGDLDAQALPTLRRLGGLQSYPSRLKDPDTVDFSTGSVGIGATAALWAAMAHRYVSSQSPDTPPPAGSSACSVTPSSTRGRSGRRSRTPRSRASASSCGSWTSPPVAGPGGPRHRHRAPPGHVRGRRVAGRDPEVGPAGLGALRAAGRCRPESPAGVHAERGSTSGCCGSTLRRWSTGSSVRTPRRPCGELLESVDTDHLAAAVRDSADTTSGCSSTPSATSTTTVRRGLRLHRQGPGLPTEGHPNNHSALLTEEQMQSLARGSGTDLDDPWAPFDPGSDPARLCAARGAALRRTPVPATRPLVVPATLGHPYRKPVSTQAALGRLLADLVRDAPDLAARVVTCSPDVASSTNLGGWINKTAVWSVAERRDWFADDQERVLRWSESQRGQHLELGIAEVNLVGLLGELGATWSRWGERLVPIATLYDPFVARALEPWSYGIYAGGQSILVGTPSGVTLAPEGGAHQSITTPSIGLEQPGCVAWEPAFAPDLEWCLLHAMDRVGVPGGTSAYFRLSTRPVDPALARLPEDDALLERRRQQAVAGGYRITDHDPADEQVTLVGVGAIMPEVLAAAETLAQAGVVAGVVCLTSPDLVFRSFQQRGDRRGGGGRESLTSSSRRRTPRPWSPCSTATRTRWPSSRRPAATGCGPWASASSASPPTCPTPTGCTGSTRRRWPAPPSTCWAADLPDR